MTSQTVALCRSRNINAHSSQTTYYAIEESGLSRSFNSDEKWCTEVLLIVYSLGSFSARFLAPSNVSSLIGCSLHTPEPTDIPSTSTCSKNVKKLSRTLCIFTGFSEPNQDHWSASKFSAWKPRHLWRGGNAAPFQCFRVR